MKLSFTGPSRYADEDEVVRICRNIWNEHAPTVITTGGATGVDTFVHKFFRTQTDVRTRICYPCAPWNEEELRELGANEFFEAFTQYRHSNSAIYRWRNECLVGFGDRLAAFLWKPEFYRSGEHMTVNIAKAHRIPIDIHIITKRDRSY